MADRLFHPHQAQQRQRSLILWITRGVFFFLLVSVGMLLVFQLFQLERESQTGAGSGLTLMWWFPLGIVACLFALGLIVDIFTPEKKISTISGVFLGILAGMLATVALSFVLDLALKAYFDAELNAETTALINALKVMLGITLSYLGVTTVLQTQDDFRLVIPYVEFAKQMRGPRPMLLDTSVIIDARIVDVAGTGLIQAPIVIPKFVIAELQQLADSTDKMKRARGRRGLDVISQLQRLPTADTTVDETPIPGKNVDQMLVELARRTNSTIVTSDTGLVRVAQINNVPTLNMNDVANAFKPSLVPGEMLDIEIIKAGEHEGQGVGYLEDGTMVIVDHAASFIGKRVDAEVTSSLQTSNGRLIFCKAVGQGVVAVATQAKADDQEDPQPIEPSRVEERPQTKPRVRKSGKPAASARNPRRQ